MIPDGYFDRFATPKYRSRNPLQRLLIRRFVRRLSGLVAVAAPRARVLEVGCGEGFLLGHLASEHPGLEFVGVDPCEEDLARLREKFPRVVAHRGSIYDLSFLSEAPDLILCCEVLEHLVDPRRGLDEMVRLVSGRPARLLLSVPDEPWFRLSNLLRGRNVRRLGNDVGHVHGWSRRSFRALLDPRVEILRSAASFPWQLVLAGPLP